MRIITTINDLKQIVNDWSGSETWTENEEDNKDAVDTIAREISSRAHDAGLRYGQDWDAFLSGISHDDCFEMLK